MPLIHVHVRSYRQPIQARKVGYQVRKAYTDGDLALPRPVHPLPLPFAFKFLMLAMNVGTLDAAYPGAGDRPLRVRVQSVPTMGLHGFVCADRRARPDGCARTSALSILSVTLYALSCIATGAQRAVYLRLNVCI